MGKPKKVISKGMGWHKESVRHSRARRLGKAGGKYAGWRHMTSSQRHNAKLERAYEEAIRLRDKEDAIRKAKIDFLMTSGIHTRKQLESLDYDDLNTFFNAGLIAKGMKDSDGDGVPDKIDCEPNNPKKQDDLELKNLGQYHGTEQYHRIFPFGKSVGTDGIVYIMQNGYSWFVTDMLSVVATKPKIQQQEFLAIKLKVNPDKTAVATIEDGNNKVLYKQEYKYTNAKRDLTLFNTNNVLMLSGEY